jgi:glycerol uptake facilitator protein
MPFGGIAVADEYQPIHGAGRSRFGLHGLWGELSAEFLGTFTLLAFGDGVVAMAVAALPGSGRTATPTTIFNAAGDWLLITWGWAIAVAMGVYVAGGVTGAHLNPAVTLGLAVRRRFPWNHVLPYWCAEIIGAFTGGLLVYWVYNAAIQAFDVAAKAVPQAGTAIATYSIFATFPAGYFHGNLAGPFIDQVVGTALLLLLVLALTDARNLSPLSNLTPFVVGLAVAAIGMSFGANAGYAINPARDFGPRMVAWIFGWGQTAFPGTYNNGGLTFSNYFWVPIVGPLLGGVIGTLVYDFFIGDVLHARKAKTAEAEAIHAGRAEPSVLPGGAEAGARGQAS